MCKPFWTRLPGWDSWHHEHCRRSTTSDYAPLVRELHRRAAILRQPVNGTFELTERCNLTCRMCYVYQAPSDRVRRATELSAAAWLEMAHHAVDNGMVFLLLTGGEVFLRPDFFELYTPLTRMGLVVTLFTNGTLITGTLAARLAEAPPGRTEITLYGATAATYEPSPAFPAVTPDVAQASTRWSTPRPARP